jgi:hypothetical protein
LVRQEASGCNAINYRRGLFRRRDNAYYGQPITREALLDFCNSNTTACSAYDAYPHNRLHFDEAQATVFGGTGKANRLPEEVLQGLGLYLRGLRVSEHV